MSGDSFDREAFHEEVGLLMRHWRNKRGLRQQDVADALELPRSTYANMELGRQRVPCDVVWRAAILLDVPLDHLFPRRKLSRRFFLPDRSA